MNLGNYDVPNETLNGLCVDVGANLGDFTNKYLNHFKKIFYIEPQIELFKNLEKRFENNSNVVGLNRAVWSESNVDLEMVAHTNTDLGSVGVKGNLINHDWTNNLVNKVQSISLEEIYKMVNYEMISYMKVDCETSEYSFLYGKDLSKINYIGIELHHHIGTERYNQLLIWIKKTHVLINGDDSHTIEKNKEVLFKLI
jgi:FkbM family methyltransferase